jgi:hypothetical protein
MNKELASTVFGALVTVLFLSTQAFAQPEPNVLERLTVIEGNGSGTGGGFVTNFASGTIKGEPFGIATFSARWQAAVETVSSNGGSGKCFRGTGEVVLTTPSGDTLTLSQSGLTCEVGFANFTK